MENKDGRLLLLMLALFTAAGMYFENATYWLVYNCAVILFSVLGAAALAKQK
jgi:hypothetical protein